MLHLKNYMIKDGIMQVILDFEDITSKSGLHQYLKEQLELPDYYGNNLDALHDCLSERGERIFIYIRNLKCLKKSLGEYASVLVEVLSEVSNVSYE